MKRDRLQLSPYQSVEAGRDINGWYFIAYSNGVAIFIRDAASLRRFLRIPKGIPMREVLESWLQTKTGAIAPADSHQQSDTSFDPLAHGIDETDPQHQTKTII